MKSVIILLGLLGVPNCVFSGTDCRMTELADRVELVCVGDEKFAAAPAVTQKSATLERLANGPVASATKPLTAAEKSDAKAPAKYDAIKAFHAYLQHDRQRIADVARKRTYRIKAIQEEMSRNPTPATPAQPADFNETNNRQEN